MHAVVKLLSTLGFYRTIIILGTVQDYDAFTTLPSERTDDMEIHSIDCSILYLLRCR